METKSADGQPTPAPGPITGDSGTSRRGIVKRARPVLSCIECRNRKLRCDRLEPCTQCQRSDRDCWYADRQIGDHGPDAATGFTEQPVKRSRHSSHPDEGHPRRISAHPAAHDKLGAAPPGWDEVASRLGRLETMLMELKTPDRPVDSRGGFGSGSGPLPRAPKELDIQAWLGLFDETDQAIGPSPKADALFGLVDDLAEVNRRLRHGHQIAREPIPVFAVSVVPIQKRMADILPRKSLCDKLLQLYFDDVAGCLYRVIHVSSFRQEYAQYWHGRGSSDTFLPRLLCVLCVAARLGTKSGGLGQDRFSIHIPTACALVRNWLDEFRGRRTADLAVLQTEVLLLLAQRTIVEDQRTLWKQLGYVFRTALDVGLQHDPAVLAALSESSKECRRRLWFALLELDLGVSLTCQRPCGVGLGDYSCKPPKNLDDADFVGTRSVPEFGSLEQSTDNQVQACFARSLPVRMEAAALLARLDAVQDYNEILDIGAKLEEVLDNINCMWPPLHFLSVEKPTGWRRRTPLDLQTWLPLHMLYRPFALSPGCPPRISLAFLRSCVAVLAFLEALDDQRLGYDVDVIPHHGELKHAVIEAAFGVCWYIKQAREGNVPGLSWSSNDDDWEDATPRYPWTGEDMVSMVARAIRWLLGPVFEYMCDMSHHLRETVALSILLGVVQRDTVEERIAGAEVGLRLVWEGFSPFAPKRLSAQGGGGHREQPGSRGEAEVVNNQAPGAGPATWADLLRRWERATNREGDIKVGNEGAGAGEVINIAMRFG